jgi:transcriptional regulator with XRE-family HTH domain
MQNEANVLKRFGGRLRELRQAAGFSQEAFAAACGLDRTYIGGIERGERNVALRNIETIAHTLGISISQLSCETREASTFHCACKITPDLTMIGV